VVQAIPDTPTNLDISVSAKPVFTNVAFASTHPGSGYQSVSAGSDPIEVFLTGTMTPVINSTALNLQGGFSQYTLVLAGLFANPSVLRFGEPADAPLPNQVELRMIDASPSAPSSLDIYMVAPGTDITNVDPVISPLSQGQASQLISLPVAKSGFAEILMIVTPSQSKTQLVNQTYKLANGQIRTLVLVDSPGGGSLSFSPLELSDLN